MIWRLVERLARAPFGEVTRRALLETAADAAHETRSATTVVSRVTRLVATLAGVIRVLLLVFASFREENPMRNLGRDAFYGWRRLRATPTFTLFAIATLALGIGVTTAVSSMVRVVVGPPSGVRDIKGIVNVYHSAHASFSTIAISWPDYQNLKAHQTTFEELTAWNFFRQAFSANGRADTAFGEIVGGEYFHVLGINAAVGRTLQPSDERIGAPPAAVISDQIWHRVFDGAPDVVGRLIKMNGHDFEIVGVAPKTFRGLFNNGFVPTAMWVPLSSVPLLPTDGTTFNLDPNSFDSRWLLVKGRLKPGRTMAEAQAEVTGIAKQLDDAYPIGRDLDPRFRSPSNTGRPWAVQAAADVIINETADFLMRPLAATLMTAVLLVLLVACTNLANLMLARGSGRQQEIAIRLALGASRWRLIRESLTESALLALAGGIAGLGVARGLLTLMGTDVDVGQGMSLHVEPSIDLVVLAAAAAATLLALVVAGLVPAWQSTRADVRSALASGAAGSGLPRWRGRRALIAGQVAVSLVLLSLAAVSLDVVRLDAARDIGMDLEHVALVQVDFVTQRYDESRARQIVDAVGGQLSRRTDVSAVAASSGLPLGVSTPRGSVRLMDSSTTARVELLASTPGIFRTLGVAIVRGRAIVDSDARGAQPAIVLSEYTARKLLGSSDVIGRQVIFKRQQWAGMPVPRDEPVTIVGVAADTDTGTPGQRDHGTAYLPLDQHYEGRLVLVARSTGDPSALVDVLRRTLHGLDPDVAVVQAGTARAIAAPPNLFLQVTAGLSSVLGSFALVLALAGLYGALSHVVARRTREMGVRVALGASAREIAVMVLRDGLRPVGFGIGVGMVLSVLARVALPSFVFVRMLPSFDPLVLVFAPASMVIAAVLACYLPARRAARVDPNVALRDL